MLFRLTYLHLTLAFSKGEGQGHEYFDCKYLVNGDRMGNSYYCYYQIGTLLFRLEFIHLILYWPIANVKVMYISTSNTSHIVTDTACITIPQSN